MSEAHRPSIFLSTPSARRATSPPGSVCQAYRYFYPRPPRGGRPHRWRRYSWQWRISIHALRGEGDQLSGPVMLLPYQFLSTPSARRATWRRLLPVSLRRFLSTPSARRATRGVGRIPHETEQFLSTPSARRATKPKPQQHMEQIYFYPRPPRGGRHSGTR